MACAVMAYVVMAWPEEAVELRRERVPDVVDLAEVGRPYLYRP